MKKCKNNKDKRLKQYMKQKLFSKIKWIVDPIYMELEEIKQKESVQKQLIDELNKKLEVKNDRVESIEQKIDNYYKQISLDRKDIICIYKWILKRAPSEKEIEYYLNKAHEDNLTLKSILTGFISSEEYDKKNQLSVPNEGESMYSQSGEDSILRFLIAQLGMDISKLSYLDIGANDPIKDNNTYRLYKLGAHGVLVEANSDLIENLKKIRPKDIVINKCIDNKSTDSSKFYIMNYDGLSSANEEFIRSVCSENNTAKVIKTIEIDTITFSEIVERYLGNTPDIVSIDIEGKELDVLKSINFTKYRPRIFIVENTPYNKLIKENKFENEIVKFMENNGYIEYAFTGINSIFIDINNTKKI